MKYGLLAAAIVATTLLFMVPLATADDLVVHAPLDNAIVDREWVNLVLEVSPGVFDEIQLTVNGRKPISVTKFHDGRFVCQDETHLSAGVNKVAMTGYRNGRAIQGKQLSVFYQTTLSGEASQPPRGFRRETFHRWEKERVCIVCHSLEPDSENLVDQSSQSKACFTCHEKMLAGEFRHEPTDDSSCLVCHDRTSKAPKSPGSHAVADLCAECHQDSLDDWREQKFGHGPTSFGSCTMCHDPHAAAHPGLLRQHASDLCLSCHPEVASRPHVVMTSADKGHPFRGTTGLIGAGEEFSCASCHNPHAGSTPYFLNQYEGGPLEVFCVSCHEMQ